jgi:hypothetical protein
VRFGAGEPNETFLVSAGKGDIFVARYDANGALLWATSAGGTESDQGIGIAGDGAGGSVVSGQFFGTARFGADEPNETFLVSAGNTDIFVARYDANGALLWATQAGGTGFDKGNGIAGDGAGGSVVSGQFEGMATFGAGEPNEATLTSAGDSTDIFVARWGLEQPTE